MLVEMAAVVLVPQRQQLQSPVLRIQVAAVAAAMKEAIKEAITLEQMAVLALWSCATTARHEEEHMNYALIENGIVINLIWLYEGNAQEFPNAVALGDRPVAIGDSYTDGVFTRGGEPVLTYAEQLEADLAAIKEALNE